MLIPHSISYIKHSACKQSACLTYSQSSFGCLLIRRRGLRVRADVSKIIIIVLIVLRTHKTMHEAFALRAHSSFHKLHKAFCLQAVSLLYIPSGLFFAHFLIRFSLHILFTFLFLVPLDFCQAVLYYYDVSNRVG